MKIQRLHLSTQLPNPLGVACIGNFDGVHRGHAALLDKALTLSQAHGLPASVIVFEPQPKEILAPDTASARLTTLREKQQLLADYHLDHCVCLRFNKQIAALSPQAFIEDMLIKQCGIKHLIVGSDFRFGYKRAGDVNLLQQYSDNDNDDFTLHVLDNIDSQEQRVSSTRIRTALAAGEIQQAQSLLGHPYFIAGRVAHGAQRGRTIGFPTANIALKRSVSPVHGVFAVQVHGLAGKPLDAIANIGKRPTVDDGLTFLLEVHILDFAQDIYGAHVKVELLKQLRDEKRFESFDALKAQIQQDEADARVFFTADMQ